MAGMVRVTVVSNESEVKRPHRGTIRAVRGSHSRPRGATFLATTLDGCAGTPRGPGTDERGRVKQPRGEVILSEGGSQTPK